MKIMEKGVHAIAPAADGTYTPIIQATGADNGNGLKRLTFSDMRRFKKAWLNAEMPMDAIIVLSQQHQEDLELEDLDLFNRMMDKGVVFGFRVFNLADKRLPRYNKTSGAKIAFAAAPSAVDSTASIVFSGNEVGRAMGTTEMYHSKAENDPIYRRDVIGFSQRAMILPIRGKGQGGIYSPTV